MTRWIDRALTVGFDIAAPLDPAGLEPQPRVREMCADGKCGAYGKNWTCPPACGTLEECGERMHSYQNGILLQTVGKLSKTIDTKVYRETEIRHTAQLRAFMEEIRQQYPDALCLGAGGCRVCKECAYPEPCRFPEKAMSSMEGYGLFVTQVCRDCGVTYCYGEKTIAYTACVLYENKFSEE